MEWGSKCWENTSARTCPSPCQISHLEEFPSVLRHSHWTNDVPRRLYLHSRQLQDFGIRGTKNLTFYQNLDFFQRFPAHTFYNRVLMCAKVSHSSWKGLKFVDNIVHLIGASIRTQRTCNTKLAHIYTNKRSWCKLAS
jgi:hypothetical protein